MRGLSNFNPGNIRISKVKYLGEITPSKDKAFKQFETMAYGYRAMFVLLDSYRRNGYKTLRQMINRYAPPVENHTANYIKFVTERARVFEDVEIDTQDPAEMIPIVSAMSQPTTNRNQRQARLAMVRCEGGRPKVKWRTESPPTTKMCGRVGICS